MEKRRFTEFYRKYLKRVYKFVLFRVGNDRRLAEDLTQDIFIKAFEAFDRYDPTVSEASWIYTIARNHIINDHAKTRPGVSLEEIEGMKIVSHDGRETFAKHHMEIRILEVVDAMPLADAQLVRMKYLEGWEFDDLAEILGKKSGALRVQAMRALKKIREHVEQKHIL